MIRLALETSTMTQSIAVEVDGVLTASRCIRQQVGHAESLLSSVQGTLEDARCSLRELDEIVCGLGPGSFTGIRIGLAFSMGIARAHDIALFGVPTPRAFAAYIPSSMAVAVALDARKAEVYGAIYAPGSERAEHLAPATWAPDAFFEHVQQYTDTPIVLCGNGPLAFSDAWAPFAKRVQYLHALHTPDASGLLVAHAQGHHVTAVDNVLEPLYIRPSDARKPTS